MFSSLAYLHTAPLQPSGSWCNAAALQCIPDTATNYCIINYSLTQLILSTITWYPFWVKKWGTLERVLTWPAPDLWHWIFPITYLTKIAYLTTLVDYLFLTTDKERTSIPILLHHLAAFDSLNPEMLLFHLKELARLMETPWGGRDPSSQPLLWGDCTSTLQVLTCRVPQNFILFPT